MSIVNDNYWSSAVRTTPSGCIYPSPWDTNTTSPLDWGNIVINEHIHEFVYSTTDAYGHLATCKTCGEVKRTPIKLGE